MFGEKNFVFIKFIENSFISLLVFSSLFSSCYQNDNLSVSNIQMNEDGELIIVYNNGTKQNFGAVVDEYLRDTLEDKNDSTVVIGVQKNLIAHPCNFIIVVPVYYDKI